jgi:hypothetical protein
LEKTLDKPRHITYISSVGDREKEFAMWAVEARNYGEEPDYWYMSGLTEAESRKRHAVLSNSGKWAMVRSWDLVAEWEREAADRRIAQWAKEREDGIGEG